ncbi:MAG TPA: N-acetylmuramoyl-L-alanine amidase, partial [Chitinophagaceae bacterium]|nr:N-acetylmuramoyl-L-alanine amidase [Chitinophagaceae bacterium]
LGDDRLGGAKVGYIDSLIPLHVTGKVGSLYKVQLSKYRTAYIPDDVVEPLPKGTFTPQSLTGDWRIYGDSLFDYVQIALFKRLPYQSFQQIDPAKIIIDVFGATNNTNWITQMENTREIKNVYYEQVEDEVLRVTIELKHQQHWGYQLSYSGNSLVIRVRRQPADLELRNLRIAVDAGHGGGNTGTYGPTGSSEKELALAVSLKLRQALQRQGATVQMTRITERFVDNKDRILLYRDSLPDLLISIHLNSSPDPIYTGGTSTYYRHIGFRNLSRDIYRRMLELGLKEWGNTGAYGPTGSSEKELALAVSLKLRQALQRQGATVQMTRITERFVDNKDRILLYRDSLPDLLVSIHLNSSADPIYTGGTSTYYRHIGFRNLSRDIYRRMLELGLKEWGNTGSFNFMLNSPIEYPNALVEILFLSNPEEEMLILDEDFQQKVADKIVLGIKDFLAGCGKEEKE